MRKPTNVNDEKQKYVKTMGGQLGLLFYALWEEVTLMYLQWHEYVYLYGTKPSRIDLLNRPAPTFFGIVQDSLWHEMLLSIARLTDPPQSPGRNKENLTIRRLPALVSHEKTKQHVQTLIKEAEDVATFCRDWRNRHLAHRDLNLVLSEGAKPLEPASRAKVQVALDAILDVLNAIEGHYMSSELYFDTPQPLGALSLVHIIDDGLRAEAEREERFRRGNFTPDDVLPRDL